MDDLISRQAALDAIFNADLRIYKGDYAVGRRNYMTKEEACSIIDSLPSAQPEPQWIPIKTRAMDEEERGYWSEQFGYDINYEDAVIFDCKMPDDGQEILVSYRKWISMDKCEIDGGCYGLEGNGDWEGVVAWMPLPEPWEGEQP